MIVHPKGLVFYCETKTHPRKPTKEQRATIDVLRSKNVVAGVAYTLEEFITLWEEAEKKVIIFLMTFINSFTLPCSGAGM